MERFKDSFILPNIISSLMKSLNEGLFTTRTVGELLWGYHDNLLADLKKFQPDLDEVFGLFYKVSFKHLLYTLCRLTNTAHEFVNTQVGHLGCFLYSCIDAIPYFLYRTMVQTMDNMCSSLVNRTTRTSLEWTRGTMKGHFFQIIPMIYPSLNPITESRWSRAL